MSYPLPQDGYDTYLTASTGTSDTELYVNVLPTKTSGVLTIYETDGRTISEKIYYTGIASAPNMLTGVVRNLRLVDSSGQILFTSDSSTPPDHPANVRIAMTDNINYTGIALAVINGDMPAGGIIKNPTARTINDPRHVVDKEYADSLTSGVLSAFLVTQNGADPSLTINVGAGYYINGATATSYAGAAAQAVTGSATNYVQLTKTGTLVINTTGFVAGNFPLAEVVTSGTDITSIADRRPWFTMALTTDQTNALAGASGTPQTSNKYETQNDTTNAATITATTLAFVNSNPDTITDSGNGFVTAGFRAGMTITVSGSASNNSTFTVESVTAGTITLVSSDSLTTESAGASVTITAAVNNKLLRLDGTGKVPYTVLNHVYGGDGSDGPLVVTSGVTTINLGGQAVVIKNYTYISITGTGSVVFTNHHANGTAILIRISQPNGFTGTSSIAPFLDASGMGATGGAAVTATGASNSGNNGTQGYGTILNTGPGLAGQVANTTISGGTISTSLQRISAYLLRYPQAFIGGGGASGAAQDQTAVTATSGAGGHGGPILIIECAGSWNFTTANGISVAGKVGGNGTYAGTRGFAQGGSGGGGGFFLGLYNTLIANTGTVNVSAGAPGTGQIVVGAGTSDNTGPSGAASGVSVGTSTTHSGSNALATPGASADGISLIAKNTEFA